VAALQFREIFETEDHYKINYYTTTTTASDITTDKGDGQGGWFTGPLEIPLEIGRKIRAVAIDWQYSCWGEYQKGAAFARFVFTPWNSVTYFSTFKVSGVAFPGVMFSPSGDPLKYIFPFNQSSREISWTGMLTQSQANEMFALSTSQAALAALQGRSTHVVNVYCLKKTPMEF